MLLWTICLRTQTGGPARTGFSTVTTARPRRSLRARPGEPLGRVGYASILGCRRAGQGCHATTCTSLCVNAHEAARSRGRRDQAHGQSGYDLKIAGDYVNEMSVLWVGDRSSTDPAAAPEPLSHAPRRRRRHVCRCDLVSSRRHAAHNTPASGGLQANRILEPARHADAGRPQSSCRVGELLARLRVPQRRRCGPRASSTPTRKRPLPLLPHTVGSHQRPVQRGRERCRRERPPPVAGGPVRDPAVAGSGQHRRRDVCRALADLDALSHVEVIVIARGGGSVEDLLPFSNARPWSAGRRSDNPVVSAIGHDVDTPLLDHVADRRRPPDRRGQARGA